MRVGYPLGSYFFQPFPLLEGGLVCCLRQQLPHLPVSASDPNRSSYGASFFCRAHVTHSSASVSGYRFLPSTHGALSPAITQRVEPTAEKMYGASAETSRVRRRQAGRAQRVLGKDRQGRSADCLAASGHPMIVLSCATEMEEWPASEPH